MSWYSTRSRVYTQLSQLTLAAAGAAALISGSAVAYGAVPHATRSAPTTVAFAFTGSPESFTVPAGVTSLALTATGAAGGPSGASVGGVGATASDTVPVTPGTVYTVEVGGTG